MIRNIFDWFGLNLYPKLSPGIKRGFFPKLVQLNLIQSDSIRDFYPNESEVNFQSEWIRINPDTEWSQTNIQSESIPTLIHSDWKSIHVRIVSDSFGLKIYFKLVRIHSDRSLGLIRINFQAFFNKRDSTRFSDWFGLIRLVSDTYFGMIRNIFYWFELNFYPKLSPGIKRALFPKLVRLNLLQSERIRSKFSIRMNPDTEWCKTNIQSETIRALIHSDWKSIHFRIVSYSFGLKIYFKLVRIHSDRSLGLIRINLQAFFNKGDSKRFWDWFGLIRIVSDTISEWFGIPLFSRVLFSPRK